MAFTGEEEEESSQLIAQTNIPSDSHHFAYIIYFTLGTGFLLPWNAFITAIDYFSYLYPQASVDRVFAVSYMILGLITLLIIVAFSHKSNPFSRINVGLALFVFSLLVVPIVNAENIKGRSGVFSGFYFTVSAIGIAGVGDGLVQGGLMGAAGELPDRYMQSMIAGTAASGVLVSLLRILTKAIFPQDPHGLRKSANLYFSFGIVFVAICIVLYNISHKLPVIKYYKDLRTRAVNEEREEKGEMSGSLWRSTLWGVVKSVKFYGLGIFLTYVITLSIFPGYITEDLHSALLRDWYSIVLITGYNVFDLVGKMLMALYMVQNAKAVVGVSFVRLLFYPLFLGCLHGPMFFRTEIPVTVLTCLLGLSNGYLTSVLMILAKKSVKLQHRETAGMVMVLFIVIGLASGSIVAWFWII